MMNPLLPLPGEVIPGNEFYDYVDKYINDKTRFIIPAQLEEKQIKKYRSWRL